MRRRAHGFEEAKGLSTCIGEPIRPGGLEQHQTLQFKHAADDLERTLQRIGQEVYSQPGTSAGDGTAGAAAGGESGTVEGEYREV